MSTIQHDFKEFINHCKYEKNLSEKTIKAYSIDIAQLVKFLIEKGADPAYRNSAGRGIDEQRAFLAEVIKRATPAQK